MKNSTPLRILCNVCHTQSGRAWRGDPKKLVTLQTMEKESFTSVKRITSSSAARSSRIGTLINSPCHHRMDETRVRLIISSKWRGSLQDVQVMRNAGGDDILPVAKIGMKRKQRLDISKL